MGMNRAHTSNWLIQIFPTMPLAIGTMRLARRFRIVQLLKHERNGFVRISGGRKLEYKQTL